MKKMCKLVKDGKIKKNKKFLELAENPTHFCEKCGRSANKEKALCDSVKF